MTTLNPNERWLIESGVNHYRVVGPGRIWLKPWQRVRAKLYVGPQGQAFPFNTVRTVENIPVEMNVQVLFQVDPALFTADLLSKIPTLNEGRWQGVLRWRVEHVLRQMVADYSWRDFGKQTIQQRLERHLTQTLADSLKVIGLKVTAVSPVKTVLPTPLQHTIIEAEQDGLEPRGRALVLKEYFEVFGQNLTEAMPHIIQWELLNLLRKNGHPNLILTASGLAFDQQSSGAEPSQPVFQMQLPLPMNG